MSYHPLYDGLWHHEDLEGASFEEKAFFIFLWSNERIRPSGIYRVSTAQLAADTELPEKRVVAYLDDLHHRLRIVRDGAWLFIRGYLARQPNQPRLMLGVERDVKSCSSRPVLVAFGEKYPLHKKWSADRLLTLTDTSHELARPEQLQSIEATEQSQLQRNPLVGQPTPDLEILEFLNRKTGKGFRKVEANLGLIRARIKDGIEPWQLKAIISRKIRDWQGDVEQAKYLRPKTLFNKTNCEQYVGELPSGDAAHAD